MKAKLELIGLLLLLVVAVPYFFTCIWQKQGFAKEVQEITQEDEQVINALLESIDMEDEEECLKAMSILLRTQIQRGDLTSDGEANVDSQYYEKALYCVQQTAGQVLTYNNELAVTAYTAVSCGKTRDYQEFLGESYPYLVSVDSMQDISDQNYLKVIYVNNEEFKEIFKTAYPEAAFTEDTLLSNIVIEQREVSGYVHQLTIAGQTLTGEEFRTLFNLNSSCFYIEEINGSLRILTKGLGHGVGLSQYGANEQAKQGATAQEILIYYFPGTTITS